MNLNPTKVSLMILKVFITIFILTLVTSLANIFPYYMAMTNVANDILMRSTMNNFVIQKDVDDIVGSTFGLQRSGDFHTYDRDINGEDNIFGSLTYKEDGGVHVYTQTIPKGSGAKPFSSGSCTIGESCSSWKNPARKVVLNENVNFDPKTNTDHLMKFRGPIADSYNGAQRGDTISVRVESKIKLKVIFIGMNITVGVPLRVTKSGPAMYYYRI